jgi:hypothetical protein
MTGIEEALRAELAREAASLDFAPSQEAWTAIQKRAHTGAGTAAGTGPAAGIQIPPGNVATRRGATIDHSHSGPARQRRHGWLMVAGSAAAAVVTALASLYAGGGYGPSGHRPAPRPATAPPGPMTALPGPAASQTGPGLNAGPIFNTPPSSPARLPNGVIRVAPPPGQPGVTMYAWSVTYQILGDPADLKPHMSKDLIAKLPTRTETDLCMSDQPPARAPRNNEGTDCPALYYLGVAVNHTPRIGFPVSGGDMWIGTATANVGSVEARYANGRVVRGFIATIPGSNVRVWALGLAGPPRTGKLDGVTLILRDVHGTFLGQGTLSATLPNPFPFQLHASAARMVRLFPGQDVPEVAVAAWGEYAVFGGPDGNWIMPGPTAYPLPARLPLQGEFEMDAGYPHSWWFGLARGDVVRIVVGLADGQTISATCPPPPMAPPAPWPRAPSTALSGVCAAIPGAPGGDRAFAIQLPQEFYGKTTIAALPHGTATAYDAVGQILDTVPLGTALAR